MGFFCHFLKSNYLIPPEEKARLVIILILVPRKPSFENLEGELEGKPRRGQGWGRTVGIQLPAKATAGLC